MWSASVFVLPLFKCLLVMLTCPFPLFFPPPSFRSPASSATIGRPKCYMRWTARRSSTSAALRSTPSPCRKTCLSPCHCSCPPCACHSVPCGNALHRADSMSWVRHRLGCAGLHDPCFDPDHWCRYPPPRALCAVPGCGNGRRYACAASGLPLCSLACYHKIRHTQEFAVVLMRKAAGAYRW